MDPPVSPAGLASLRVDTGGDSSLGAVCFARKNREKNRADGAWRWVPKEEIRQWQFGRK